MTEIEVTKLDINLIRLKVHGVPGDKGPELIIDEIAAREIIRKLQSVLPEGEETQT